MSESGIICSTNSSTPEFTTCTLPTDRSSVDLSELLTLATVDENTVMWIEAWGANGGNGTSTAADGGDAGKGGQAVTVTTLADFKSRFGTSTLYYYVGNNGHHDDGGGGDGGASTVVLTVEPTGQTLTLDGQVPLFLAPRAVRLTASRAAVALPPRSVRLRGGTFGRVPTIGSAPQTR